MKKKGQITITECLSADPFLLIYSTMNVPTPLIPTKFIEDSSTFLKNYQYFLYSHHQNEKSSF